MINGVPGLSTSTNGNANTNNNSTASAENENEKERDDAEMRNRCVSEHPVMDLANTSSLMSKRGLPLEPV
jgi:hypothetical protein